MRTPLTANSLAQLVVADLRARVAIGADFTAYDVTSQLRKVRPDLDIRHAPVRLCVHRYMSALVSEGLYQASLRRFGRKEAIQYEPASRDVWVDGVPLLPLDGG